MENLARVSILNSQRAESLYNRGADLLHLTRQIRVIMQLAGTGYPSLFLLFPFPVSRHTTQTPQRLSSLQSKKTKRDIQGTTNETANSIDALKI